MIYNELKEKVEQYNIAQPFLLYLCVGNVTRYT